MYIHEEWGGGIECGWMFMLCGINAAINCVPHSPHYGKGWGMVGDWEI